MPTNLLAAERRAEAKMRSRLKEPEALATETFDLLANSVGAVPERPGDSPSPRAKGVTSLLMLRVANDLRAASHLACLGYPQQAMALIAGLYEASLTILHMGTDEGQATKWTKHTDPFTVPWKFRALTRSAASKLGGGDRTRTAEIDRQLWDYYSQFCMVKHSHPDMSNSASFAWQRTWCRRPTDQIRLRLLSAVHGLPF